MYTKEEQEEYLFKANKLMTKYYQNYIYTLVSEDEKYASVQKWKNIFFAIDFYEIADGVHLGIKVTVPYSLGSEPLDNNWSYSSEGDEHSYMKLCRLTQNRRDVLVKFRELAVAAIDVIAIAVVR